MSDIRVYFAFRSPYSRLGLHMLDRAGLTAQLVPFTGPPEGAAFSDPMANPLKLSYYMQDAPRMTMRMGLPMRAPIPFEADVGPANKAAVAAEIDGKGLAFAIAVSDARWGKGRDISEMPVLEKCAEIAGWSKARLEEAQSCEEVSKTLKRHRELIRQDGVFGVPFAVMGDQKYWGHDRFHLLAEDAATALAS